MITEDTKKRCVNSCIRDFIDGITYEYSMGELIQLVIENRLSDAFTLEDINTIVNEYGLAIFAISETVNIQESLANIVREDNVIDPRHFSAALLKVVLKKYPEWMGEFLE